MFDHYYNFHLIMEYMSKRSELTNQWIDFHICVSFRLSSHLKNCSAVQTSVCLSDYSCLRDSRTGSHPFSSVALHMQWVLSLHPAILFSMSSEDLLSKFDDDDYYADHVY